MHTRFGNDLIIPIPVVVEAAVPEDEDEVEVVPVTTSPRRPSCTSLNMGPGVTKEIAEAAIPEVFAQVAAALWIAYREHIKEDMEDDVTFWYVPNPVPSIFYGIFC